jgi:hypothetical protein
MMQNREQSLCYLQNQQASFIYLAAVLFEGDALKGRGKKGE